MNNRFNKKGQAAIEFLMTYGWMLLVVLIVGALIFSFVDFGSLLPSQVDLSPPLRGDNALVSAQGGLTTSKVQFILSFIGSRSSLINFSKATLTSDVGANCDPSPDKNDYKKNKGQIGSVEEVQVLNGDLIQVVFICHGLNSGDVYEGEAKFEVVDSRTGFITTSKGRIRVSIN